MTPNGFESKDAWLLMKSAHGKAFVVVFGQNMSRI
jgi:hypothetical protein